MIHLTEIFLLLASVSGLATQTAASRDHDILRLLFREKLQKAEQGDVQAQESVAFAYQCGVGANRDDEAAIRWYQKAASSGSGSAMSAVGEIFEQKKNYAGAFEWYSKAAERRYPHALYRLGIMYQQGWHVPKDGSKAVALFEESAWLDSVEAQHYLGILYAQGRLVPKSYVRSYAWLNIMATNKVESAQLRDELEKQLTQEQLAEAQKLSLEWVERLKTVKK